MGDDEQAAKRTIDSRSHFIAGNINTMLRFDATRILRDVETRATQIIVEAAKDVLDISQQLVPVDSGDLRRSGRVEQVSPTKVRIVYGNETVNYAKFVEYGSANGPAQPYLTPAMAQAESIIRAKAIGAKKNGR